MFECSTKSRTTNDTARELRKVSFGTSSTSLQKPPPPKKGFRNTDLAAFSQSPKDHNEDRAREGAVSPFENDDPDADDDVSLLSMGSLAHGDRAGGMNIGAVPSSIRDKKPIASKNQALLLSSNSDTSRSVKGGLKVSL